MADVTMDQQPIWQSDQLDLLVPEQLKLLCDRFSQTGYLFLQLSDTDTAAIYAARAQISQFFKLGSEDKLRFHAGEDYRYWGYNNMPSLRKEHLKLRQHDSIPWPEDTNYVLGQAIVGCDILARSAQKLAKVLIAYIGVPKEVLATMFEAQNMHSKMLSSADRSAVSFGESFLYHGNNSDDYVEPCPTHQDMGLLTIIPAAEGVPALEVVNWASRKNGFQNVELSTQMQNPGVCVVFPGNLMERLSNQFYVSTPHRVVVRIH
jgi:isopenicillin N synthase-like dioxygenase